MIRSRLQKGCGTSVSPVLTAGPRRHVLLAALLLLLPCGPAPATFAAEPLTDLEALDLFNRASECYVEASALPGDRAEEALQLYRRAAELYEQILARGFKHQDIYYNLGNTYFKLNNLGRAVLNYRRAQRYLPADADLLENIRSIKSRILDPETDRSPPELLRTLLFWHYDTPLTHLIGVAWMTYLLFCAGICIGIFYRIPVIRWANWTLAFFVFILAISFVLRIFHDNTVRVAVVTATAAPVRTGYGEHETERFTVHEGAELIVEDARNAAPDSRWLKVALSKELRGWIRADAVEIIQSGLND